MDCIQYWARVLPPPVEPYSDTTIPFRPVNAYSGEENATPSANICTGISALSSMAVKSLHSSIVPLLPYRSSVTLLEVCDRVMSSADTVPSGFRRYITSPKINSEKFSFQPIVLYRFVIVRMFRSSSMYDLSIFWKYLV